MFDEPVEFVSLIGDAAQKDGNPARFGRVISTMPTKLSIVLTDIPEARGGRSYAALLSAFDSKIGRAHV